MDKEKLLRENKDALQLAQKRYIGGLTYTCRYCKITFIGPHAANDWSVHTWTHYFAGEGFAND